MTNALLIVFVKNLKLGTVKTRLAKTIGDYGAFEVYSELLKITEKATSHLPYDKRIYFSDVIINEKWPGEFKTVQEGNDLGDRMGNAFKKGFDDGYKSIVLIGSDLPQISSSHIKNGFEALKDVKAVFGPAEDGGYYLIGLSEFIELPFKNKPWSQPNLLPVTLEELKAERIEFKLLEVLNDIDTYEDLISSDFYKNNRLLQEKIQQLND